MHSLLRRAGSIQYGLGITMARLAMTVVEGERTLVLVRSNLEMGRRFEDLEIIC